MYLTYFAKLLTQFGTGVDVDLKAVNRNWKLYGKFYLLLYESSRNKVNVAFQQKK